MSSPSSKSISCKEEQQCTRQTSGGGGGGGGGGGWGARRIGSVALNTKHFVHEYCTAFLQLIERTSKTELSKTAIFPQTFVRDQNTYHQNATVCDVKNDPSQTIELSYLSVGGEVEAAEADAPVPTPPPKFPFSPPPLYFR